MTSFSVHDGGGRVVDSSAQAGNPVFLLTQSEQQGQVDGACDSRSNANFKIIDISLWPLPRVSLRRKQIN